MLTIAELRRMAQARLRDAEVLLGRGRSDGAVYLCGYAVEMALKARICRTLRWEGFPETGSEFRDFQSFRTHDLEVLLHMSGVEQNVLSRFPSQWASVATWSPDRRYFPIGTTSPGEAANMVEAARVIVRAL
ncbi:MAG: HEPN domain-containing protein [Chloroflexi bacterium]|nr:HEPN domain-containing protein [Chloroflexota bacterium]